MPDYTVSRGAAGSYVATLTRPDLAQAQLKIEPGDVLVEGDFGPMTWWNGLGVQNLPPKPEDWLVWDGSAWVDPRDPAQRETDLHVARYAISTDKRQVS